MYPVIVYAIPCHFTDFYREMSRDVKWWRKGQVDVHQHIMDLIHFKNIPKYLRIQTRIQRKTRSHIEMMHIPISVRP